MSHLSSPLHKAPTRQTAPLLIQSVVAYLAGLLSGQQLPKFPHGCMTAFIVIHVRLRQDRI